LHKTEVLIGRQAARGAAYPPRSHPGLAAELESVLVTAIATKPHPPPPRPVGRPRLERPA